MGVQGLTPFLQKNPEVIRQLPDRLKALSGKTVVIDGTLITQRLHFAPMQHPYRHVLGWYKLIKELKDSEIRTICVFDGQERAKAKAREAERRRNMQRLAASRGVLENDRLQRLRKLSPLLSAYNTLSSDGQAQTSALLRKLSEGPDISEPVRQELTISKFDANVLDEIVRKMESIDFNLGSQPPDARETDETSGQTSHEMPSTPLKSPPYDHHLTSFPAFSDSESPPFALSHQSNDSGQTVVTDDSCQHQDSGSNAITRSQADFDPTFLTTAMPDGSPQARATPVPDPPPVSIPFLPETPPMGSLDGQATDIASQTSTVSQLADPPPTVSLASQERNSPPPSLPPPLEPGDGNTSVTTAESRQQLKTSTSGSVTDSLPDFDVRIPPIAVSPQAQDILVPPLIPPHNLPAMLASLYLDYRQSLPTLNALSATVARPDPDALADSGDTDSCAEYVMSKNQLQLTIEEGKFWDRLLARSASAPTPSSTELEPELSPSEDAQITLALLQERSSSMFMSFQRRTNPPSKQTYNDCKEILHAMGVPCVDVDGEYEAEALAASLVLNGRADYVVSEDTDVLVYEAPLLRNITNRTGPLLLVFGADIRANLSLSRSSYVDFALLLGTDFSQRIKNIGPMRALKFIRAYGSIERIVENEKKFPPREPVAVYLEEVEVARAVFGRLPPVPKEEMLRQRESDEVVVARVLEKFRLQREVMVEWDYKAELEGNYFEDNPRAW